MIDVRDILNSWITSFKPSDSQKTLAQARFSVCNACPSKKSVKRPLGFTLFCNECGCPIKAKVFSEAINPCPLKKWEDIDKNHNLNTRIKKTNTLF